MNIAILGATSEIAKDLVLSISKADNHSLVLFGRNPRDVEYWLRSFSLNDKYPAYHYDFFNDGFNFDAVINFVGIGDPAKAFALGGSIFEISLHYDELALRYIKSHLDCRYIYISSGAVYGKNFESPIEQDSVAIHPINCFQAQDWYSAAKFYAECRHRSLEALPIVDVRVFNYFSATQNMNARFFIADIYRAIRDDASLITTEDCIVRDYLHPADFHQLVNCILHTPPINTAVDCYTLAPIDKRELLAKMELKFNLRYEFDVVPRLSNGVGSKPFYYSLNRSAEFFGYHPLLTSWQGISTEFRKLLA